MGHTSSKSTPSKLYKDGKSPIKGPEPLQSSSKSSRRDSDDSSRGIHRRTKSALAGPSSTYSFNLHPEDAPPSYGDAVFPGSSSYSGSNHLAVPTPTEDQRSRESNNPFLRSIGRSSSLSVSQRRVAASPSRAGHSRSEQERLEYLRRPLRKESYENALQQLKKYDTIILVDDSGSMSFNGRWEEARRALATLADVAAQWDADGFDIYFLNDEVHARNCTRAVEVIRLFDTVQPTGITPIGDRLNAILNDYLDELDAAKKAMREEAARSFKTDGPRKTKLPKPVNILVLTDGVPTDDPYSVIKDVATRMDRANYLLSQVGIQFVQIGNDITATRYLRKLDDDIASSVPKIRDIVDTTPYLGKEVSSDMIVKIMLGGINRREDQKML